jgi:hypothetical protein
LHELSAFEPDHATYERRLGRGLGVAIGLTCSSLVAVLTALGSDTDGEWLLVVVVGGAAFALAYGAAVTGSRSLSILAPIDWRARLTSAGRGFGLNLLIAAGLSLALVGALSVPGGSASFQALAPIIGVFGVPIALGGGLLGFVRPGTVAMSSDPPRRLIGRQPTDVLREARTAAVRTVAATVLTFAIVLALTLLVLDVMDAGLLGSVLSQFLFIAGLVVFPAALVVGGREFRPLFTHYWIRRDLARRGCIPRRLPEFLAWCTLPERGWLRASDAYEFRHRQLLEYLAGATEPDHGPPSDAGPPERTQMP